MVFCVLCTGEQYALKMRFLDHVFDEMIVDQMLLKIILPEGVKDVHLRSVLISGYLLTVVFSNFLFSMFLKL